MSVAAEMVRAIAVASGNKGVEALAEALQQIAPRTPVEAAILRVLVEVTEERGPWLVHNALGQVEEFLKEPEKVSKAEGFLSLRQRSDIVAALQIAEADSRAQAIAWLEDLGKAAGLVFMAALRASL